MTSTRHTLIEEWAHWESAIADWRSLYQEIRLYRDDQHYRMQAIRSLPPAQRSEELRAIITDMHATKLLIQHLYQHVHAARERLHTFLQHATDDDP